MRYRIIKYIFPLVGVIILFAIIKYHISVWYVLIPALLNILLLVLGAIFIQWNFYIKSVNSVAEFKNFMPIDENKKNICLTFDDGIHPVNTPLALDILKKKNVPAHFFIIGKNITGNELILKRMYNEGHSIGNHSQHHLWNFDLQSTAKMQQEIENTNRMIKDIAGTKPVIFRPPYGVTNPNLARAVENTNMLSMGWNLRSLDTVAKDRNELLAKLIRKTRPNSIVLLHERCDITIDILTDYIDYCLREGYTFVTLKPRNEV